MNVTKNKKTKNNSFGLYYTIVIQYQQNSANEITSFTLDLI